MHPSKEAIKLSVSVIIPAWSLTPGMPLGAFSYLECQCVVCRGPNDLAPITLWAQAKAAVELLMRVLCAGTQHRHYAGLIATCCARELGPGALHSIQAVSCAMACGSMWQRVTWDPK